MKEGLNNDRFNANIVLLIYCLFVPHASHLLCSFSFMHVHNEHTQLPSSFGAGLSHAAHVDKWLLFCNVHKIQVQKPFSLFSSSFFVLPESKEPENPVSLSILTDFFC